MNRRKRKNRRGRPVGSVAYKPHIEYQETTMQVPFGMGSALTLLTMEHELKPVDAVIALTLNYRSNWQNGRTHWTSRRKFAELLGISTRYLRQSVTRLKDTLVRIVNVGQKGTIYELTHHRCDEADIPRDKDGLPLKFAVPRGNGGPFERMFAGEISWKACLLWVVLKRFSDWKTGMTNPCTMETLSKLTRFGKQTVCELITELREAGMLERLSKSHEISVFQLYPKPPEKRAVKRRPAEQRREMRAKGDWRYSFNEQYRINIATHEIDQKKGGRWKPIRDCDRHRMPGAIHRDFERAVIVASMSRAQFGIA